MNYIKFKNRDGGWDTLRVDDGQMNQRTDPQGATVSQPTVTAWTSDAPRPRPATPYVRNNGTHGETPHQRLNRRYAEILQEVRVAQTGTQDRKSVV